MNKEFIYNIYKRLKEEVPTLKWIDLNTNQLESSTRPSVAYPCCLLDMEYVNCEALAGAKQKVKIQFEFTVAIDSLGASTHAATPNDFLTEGFLKYDLLKEIHRALQWWNGDGLWMRLERRNIRKDKNNKSYESYKMIYQTDAID